MRKMRRQIDIIIDEYTDGWMVGTCRLDDGWMEWMNRSDGWMDKWNSGWLDGLDGLMDKWTKNGWINDQIHVDG